MFKNILEGILRAFKSLWSTLKVYLVYREQGVAVTDWPPLNAMAKSAAHERLTRKVGWAKTILSEVSIQEEAPPSKDYAV